MTWHQWHQTRQYRADGLVLFTSVGKRLGTHSYQFTGGARRSASKAGGLGKTALLFGHSFLSYLARAERTFLRRECRTQRAR